MVISIDLIYFKMDISINLKHILTKPLKSIIKGLITYVDADESEKEDVEVTLNSHHNLCGVRRFTRHIVFKINEVLFFMLYVRMSYLPHRSVQKIRLGRHICKKCHYFHKCCCFHRHGPNMGQPFLLRLSTHETIS